MHSDKDISASLLLELIEALSMCPPEKRPDNLTTLKHWLNETEEIIAPAAAPQGMPGESIESRALRHIFQLFKSLRFSAKELFTPYSFTTLEEFGLLATLGGQPGLTKTELIHYNQLELSSGNDMIRRLLQQNLVVESDDPDDRRLKRLHLSPEGRQQLLQAFEVVDALCHQMLEPLKISDRLLLLDLLRRIDKHAQQYET